MDVLLLCDVFEVFRIKYINSFELDPAHYVSTPGYSWDKMLKFIVFNWKLISDIESINSLKSQ